MAAIYGVLTIPGTVLSTLHVLRSVLHILFNPLPNAWSRYYHSHFVDEKNEALRGLLACSRPDSKIWDRIQSHVLDSDAFVFDPELKGNEKNPNWTVSCLSISII